MTITYPQNSAVYKITAMLIGTVKLLAKPQFADKNI
jgi:hypothetical protein